MIRDEYNEARIARNLQGLASSWWLWSPGYGPDFAARVLTLGEIDMLGTRAYWDSFLFGEQFGWSYIRPAMWINLTP